MKVIMLLTLIALLSGCATAPPPQLAVHGLAVETLQGAVNISITTHAGQMSGNGIILYRRPDSFRLSILAPFGQIVMDIIVQGDNVLCIMDSRKTAWKGKTSDLPLSLGARVWPLLKWVMEPPHPPGPSLERTFVRPDGTVEKIYYDSAGFVQRKVNSMGDEIFYGDYRVTGTIAIPNRIEINAAEGSRLTLGFDDPELNQPVADEVLNPGMDGLRIIPLAEFIGF